MDVLKSSHGKADGTYVALYYGHGDGVTFDEALIGGDGHIVEIGAFKTSDAFGAINPELNSQQEQDGIPVSLADYDGGE